MGDLRRIDGDRKEVALTLDDLAREGARRRIAAALEVEVDEYVASFIEEVAEDGKRLVVRNDHAHERRVTVGSGTVRIRAPRVNTSASTMTRASGASSAPGSCLPTRGVHRRSPMCCRSSAWISRYRLHRGLAGARKRPAEQG